MSPRRSTLRIALSTFFGLGFASLMSEQIYAQVAPAPTAAAAAPAREVIATPSTKQRAASRVESYRTAEGQEFFALSLMPQAPIPMSESNDIVILFDTSASQTGAYREKALAALNQLVSTLNDKDRVALYSVDVNAVPLTKTLVSPRSAEFTAAMAQLKQRAPLGSTDMGEAIKAANGVLSTGAQAKRVVYIGDGQNNAGMAGAELRSQLDQLMSQHISLSSFAIGPELNNAFLASLSNLTGGVLLIDADNFTGQQAGQMLAGVTREGVFWPSKNNLPADCKIYPTQVPPLRSDRDTIVLGKGKLSNPLALEISGKSQAADLNMKWNVQPTDSKEDNAYLAQLVDMAHADQGYGLPTLGTEGLYEARFMVNQSAAQLAKLGHQAHASGNADHAKALVNESLRRNPQDERALAVRGAMERAQVKTVSMQAPVPAANGNDIVLKRTPPAPLPDANFAPGLLDNVEERIALIEQKLRGEVLQGLNEARSILSTNPPRAEADLKKLLDRVDNLPDIRSVTRSELRDMLTKTIREAQSRGYDWELQRQRQLETLQAAEDRKQALESVYRVQAQVKQLMQRYNALLDEGRYKDAELYAAAQAYRLEPSPVTNNAVRFAFTQGVYAENVRIRKEKARNWINAQLSIESSAIPFPDNTPITYPDADTWRKLTRDREKYKQVDLVKPGGAEEKISRELQSETSFLLEEATLQDFIDMIKTKHKIEVQYDKKALDDATFDYEAKFNKSISNVSLRSALRLILKDYDLSYMIKNDVLLITTKTAQEADPVVKVYPVADLVIPITNGGGINPFGLGGGQGGGGPGAFGGGGQGGGQGIGGFNGGGFGGNGGGFGGNGGGFFNVADPVVFPAANNEVQAWAVPAESVVLKPQATKAPAPSVEHPADNIDLVEAQSKIEQELNAKPTRITLTIPAGSDAETAWSQFFADATKVPGETDGERMLNSIKQDRNVRETARQLMNEQKYQDVCAMIRAALKNGFGQPWMYEAMGLAMIADNQPVVEIERALMSAVDYARNTDDLLMTAIYMTKVNGLQGRALKLLRRVTELEPQRNEPYMLALNLAEQVGDVAAIEWVTVGLLSQACTREQQPLENQAKLLAVSTIEKLHKAGKKDEADRFRAAIAKAESRDLRIRVSWTGDADIDLAVEEPTGTVCNLSQPRTIAGGVMLGDTSAATRNKPNTGTHTEEYVVPQGFAGTYRMLLKRVWGQPTAGKVTVEIISQAGTAEQVVKREQIPVGEKPAMVIYELAKGRRVETLAAAQVMVAAQQQQQVGQAILAQQIAALPSNPNSAGGAVNRPNPIANGAFPFFGNRQVGYMPIITTLPEGANMSAQAVISADRRYVRITATPLFSIIPEVSTFNFSTGAGTTTPQTPNGGGAGGLF